MEKLQIDPIVKMFSIYRDLEVKNAKTSNFNTSFGKPCDINLKFSELEKKFNLELDKNISYTTDKEFSCVADGFLT